MTCGYSLQPSTLKKVRKYFHCKNITKVKQKPLPLVILFSCLLQAIELQGHLVAIKNMQILANMEDLPYPSFSAFHLPQLIASKIYNLSTIFG